MVDQERGYIFAGYTLDLVRGSLRKGDREIKLRPQTFKILIYFVSNTGRLLSKDELMEVAWSGLAVTDDSLVQCVKEIRRAIDDCAQVLIKTVPGRGYLFDLPVEIIESREPKVVIGTKPEVFPAGTIQPANPASWLERLRALDWKVVAAGIGVLVLISIGWWVRAPVPPQVLSPVATVPPRLSIVVLPFANLSGEPAQDYFTDGVTDNLTTDLSVHVSGLFVISRNTAFTFKGKNVDAQQVGRDLGVRYVLEGSVQRSGDQVRVNAQLVDAQTGAHLWAERFEEERRDLFALQDRITGRIANTLRIQLVQAAARDTDPRKSDPDAADLVMRGRAIYSVADTLENLDQAVTSFRKALEIDDRSVDANVGLAVALIDRMVNWRDQNGSDRDSILREANAAADRALALDPDAAAAHNAKGFILRAERRFPEAAHEFEIAIARDPNFSEAYDNLGAAQYRLGQPEKAIPLLEKALRLSPRDANVPFVAWHLGLAHLFQHHYGQAVEHFLNARAANSNLGWLTYNLAAAYELSGDDETARRYVAEALAWKPTLTITAIKATRESDNPDYLRLREETLIEGLRKAGVSEQ
jgi:TolB-like protein/DNA-binding winged helix-turn-helix (wHTH) protein/tetratricopeptide (TPR) repeat protein